MTDNYKHLRDALADGPTPGPWSACGSAGYVQAGEGHPRHVILAVAYGHDGNHQINAPGSRENGRYIAAANPETIRALLAERDALREALQKVRPVIAADRQALLDCHGDGNEIPAADKLGTLGLYEYDGALNAIDAALAQHQVGGAH